MKNYSTKHWIQEKIIGEIIFICMDLYTRKKSRYVNETNIQIFQLD